MSPSQDHAGPAVLDWTEGSQVMLVTMGTGGPNEVGAPRIFMDGSPYDTPARRLLDVEERCLLPASGVAFLGTPEGEGKDRRLVWVALHGSALHVTKPKAVRISG